MRRKANMAIWIPVILALITSLTTITVTYIEASTKVAQVNESRTQGVRTLSVERMAKLGISIKGFYASTNR